MRAYGLYIYGAGEESSIAYMNRGLSMFDLQDDGKLYYTYHDANVHRSSGWDQIEYYMRLKVRGE